MVIDIHSKRPTAIRPVIIATALAIVTTFAFAGRPRAQALNPMQLEPPRCARVPAGRAWTFVAFFYQYSDQINARTRERLDNYASLFMRHHISALTMNAFTDSSEAADQDLGARRARTVQVFLAEAGIPPEIVVIHDFGASLAMLPTRPGVPEPQNRRIEFAPVLHSTDQELKDKRDCEEWLRQHADECGGSNATGNATACELTRKALSYWYFRD